MSTDSEQKLSLSKQRKLQKQEEMKREKRNKVLGRLVAVVLCLAVVGLIVFAVVKSINEKANRVEMSADFSAQLTDDGMIKDVKASDYVTLCDYENITAPLSEIEYSDEDVNNDIRDILEQYKSLDTETTAAVVDGDTVSIDYAGSVDGVAFDGGTAEDADLEIGSGTFIDNFEEQIIGHVIGDNFDVNVTFPEPYENNPDLAGQPAVFNVTLKGIYKAPEFTDEFVAENLSEYASTADEYTEYIKKTNYDSNLFDYVEKYLLENCKVSSIPKDYMKQLKANYKYNQYATYEYMNSLYQSIQGTIMYTDFNDYLSKSLAQTEEEFDASIEENISDAAKSYMICQALAEKLGITVSRDEAQSLYAENGGTADDFESQITTYGTGYVLQAALDSKVVKAIAAMISVQ